MYGEERTSVIAAGEIDPLATPHPRRNVAHRFSKDPIPQSAKKRTVVEMIRVNQKDIDEREAIRHLVHQ